MFPDWVISGGDIQWTAKATRSGFLLVYASKAVVKHPARSLKALLKKQHRVGRGLTYVYVSNGKSLLRIIASAFISFLPPRWSSIKKIIYQRGTEEMRKKMLSIWCVSYLCNLSKALGILISVLNFLRKRDQKRW